MADYLDNMDVPEGHHLRCKSAICCKNITVGLIYSVTYRNNIAGIVDDSGEWIIPSARFIWAYNRKGNT